MIHNFPVFWDVLWCFLRMPVREWTMWPLMLARWWTLHGCVSMAPLESLSIWVWWAKFGDTDKLKLKRMNHWGQRFRQGLALHPAMMPSCDLLPWSIAPSSRLDRVVQAPGTRRRNKKGVANLKRCVQMKIYWKNCVLSPVLLVTSTAHTERQCWKIYGRGNGR